MVKEKMSKMSEEGGKAKTPPLKRKQSIYWKCNYHIKDNETFEEIVEQIEQAFKHTWDEYVLGEEYGKYGETPHLECYLKFRKKTEFNSIQKLFKWSDLRSSCKKNMNAGLIYCQKEGNRLWTNIKIEKPYIEEISELYKWEEKILDTLNTEPDNRSIYWIWESEGGRGKTIFQKYIFTHLKEVVVLSGKGADMKNGVVKWSELNGGNLPKIVLINIPRYSKDFVCYGGIEEIKDMFFFSGKYEGGMVCGASPHVLVFSNQEPYRDPETGESHFSEDRLKIIKI